MMTCLQLCMFFSLQILLLVAPVLDSVYDDVYSSVYVFFPFFFSSDPAAVCIAGGAVPGVCRSQQCVDWATLKQGLVPLL